MGIVVSIAFDHYKHIFTKKMLESIFQLKLKSLGLKQCSKSSISLCFTANFFNKLIIYNSTVMN